MYLIILLFPLTGFFICIFFGKKIGNKGSSLISTLFVLVSFILSINCFIQTLCSGKVVTFNLFPWIHSGFLNIYWGFIFDSLTSVILVVVTSVSFFVHLYSTSYISADPHLSRFISYLSFFTFFILILITADNFIQIFVGWEGVGLCSFLLINFWFTRIQANKAAIKAILVNRVGDFFLVLGLVTLFFEFGTLDYNSLFILISFSVDKEIIFINLSFYTIDVASFFLFIGAVGKSAQIGLHTWLPDAIEGPTPVSALIHAATIVTAGVFLLVRSSFLFEHSKDVLWLITLIGGLTAFFAASTGFVQHDLKKVIAYSTCSQLGYIVFSCGLSAYNVSLFHLANHAFFKALLFLTAGCVIHSINDEQDMRKIGGLNTILPYSYTIILIGSFSLIGFPFLTGFYSKDVILELAYSSFSAASYFTYWLGTFSAFCTAYYSIRLVHLTFLSNPRGFKKNYENAHESSYRITIPLFILYLGSIFFGFFCKDFIIGLGSDYFSFNIFIIPKNYFIIDAEFLPTSIKILPVCFSFFGLALSFINYSFFYKEISNIKINYYGQIIFIFFNKKWFFDKIYNEIINQNIATIAYNNTYKQIDKGLLESFGPFGISFNLITISKKWNKLQTGHIYHYTFIIITFFIFIIIIHYFFVNSFFYNIIKMYDLRILILYFFIFFILLWVYSSVVEQSPFKSLVEGSIPSTPNRRYLSNLCLNLILFIL